MNNDEPIQTPANQAATQSAAPPGAARTRFVVAAVAGLTIGLLRGAQLAGPAGSGGAGFDRVLGEGITNLAIAAIAVVGLVLLLTSHLRGGTALLLGAAFAFVGLQVALAIL